MVFKKYKFCAFSLVELMISLITISLITAAFAPVITKKLSASVITIGNSNNSIVCDIANCASCGASGKCVACDLGYQINGLGLCTKCESGTYYQDGSCIACPVGYACPNGMDKNKCADGTYTEVENETSCKDCPSGSYCASGLRYLCQAGTYSGEKATSCTTCEAGKYNTTTGQSSCTTCEAGYYCTGGTNHVKCSEGTYSTSTSATEASTCKSCEAGYYCTGGNNHVKCSAGTYSTSTSATEASTCKSCEAGYYCTGGNAKTACENGTYSTGGASSCTTSTIADCKTYSKTSNACTACNTNYQLTSGKCMWTLCTTANGLFKLTADLGNGGVKTYCITQYNIGDHSNYRLPSASSTYWLRGIYQVGSGDTACRANYTTGCCWQGYTGNSSMCTSSNGSYSGCQRTVCNWYAAYNLCNTRTIKGAGGWRLPTNNELKNLSPDTYSKTTSAYPGNKGLMFCDHAEPERTKVSRCNTATCIGTSDDHCNPWNLWSGTADSNNAYFWIMDIGTYVQAAWNKNYGISFRCVKEL